MMAASFPHMRYLDWFVECSIKDIGALATLKELRVFKLDTKEWLIRGIGDDFKRLVQCQHLEELHIDDVSLYAVR